MDSMEICQFIPLNPSAENVLINILSRRAWKAYNTRKTDEFYEIALFLRQWPTPRKANVCTYNIVFATRPACVRSSQHYSWL